MRVKYVGHRPTITDSLYGTGSWEKDQEKEVPAEIGKKMLRHPDVYVPGDEIVDTVPGDNVEVIETTDAPDAKNEDKAQDSRDLVAGMNDVEQVKSFITTNFGGQKIHHKIGLEKAKQQAIQLIDQFGMP